MKRDALMVKYMTNFQTKTARKPYPLGRHIQQSTPQGIIGIVLGNLDHKINQLINGMVCTLPLVAILCEVIVDNTAAVLILTSESVKLSCKIKT